MSLLTFIKSKSIDAPRRGGMARYKISLNNPSFLALPRPASPFHGKLGETGGIKRGFYPFHGFPAYPARTVVVSLFLFIFMLTVSTLSAAPTSSVGLIYFDAIPQVDGILLQWATASELDTAGFRLRRVSNNGSDAVDLTDMIAAEGNPTLGAAYRFVDETAVSNIPYTYLLIEIELSAVEQILASVKVTAPVQPTNSAIGPLPTVNPPAQSQPTETAVINSPSPTAIPETAVPATTTPSIQPPTATNAQQETGVVTRESTPQAVQSTQEIAQVAAIVQAQSTPSDGYPAQATVNPSATIEGYPVNPPPVITNNTDPTPYPPPVATENGRFVSTPQNLTTIGEDPVDEGLRDLYAPEAVEPINKNVVRGRLFLWFGFILTGLIFGIAVVGSMLFFVRRK